jgi:hypothetical protein
LLLEADARKAAAPLKPIRLWSVLPIDARSVHGGECICREVCPAVCFLRRHCLSRPVAPLLRPAWDRWTVERPRRRRQPPASIRALPAPASSRSARARTRRRPDRRSWVILRSIPRATLPAPSDPLRAKLPGREQHRKTRASRRPGRPPEPPAGVSGYWEQWTRFSAREWLLHSRRRATAQPRNLRHDQAMGGLRRLGLACIHQGGP